MIIRSNLLRHRIAAILGAALPLSLFLAASVSHAAGRMPSHSPAPAPATYSDSGIEPQLTLIFEDIAQNRLESALERTEALLRAYPTYRLGHLIKGDLLLARAQPLAAFGAAGTSGERVSDLRDEAVARLRAQREKPPADHLPRALLQMSPEQKNAIVVDAQKSRLYVFENDKGLPRLVSDYYITHGKLGVEKMREGDKKTPVGVYHVTASLDRRKLTDFYGSGAFPINYPNEWDKRQGRNGSGIWLHGTPSDTFSRPPRASDGCVVLANTDLDAMSKSVQVGLTPVIIAPSLEWVPQEQWEGEKNQLAAAIEQWRADWESRDTEKYLRHYSSRFSVGSQDFAAFSAQKRQVNAGKAWIKLGIDKLSFFRSPGKEELAVVTFDQDYRSNNLNNQMKKRQYWLRENGEWKIIYEGAA